MCNPNMEAKVHELMDQCFRKNNACYMGAVIESIHADFSDGQSLDGFRNHHMWILSGVTGDDNAAALLIHIP